MKSVRETEQETVRVQGKTVTVYHHAPDFPSEADRLLRREEINAELYRLLAQYAKTGKQEKKPRV